MNKLRLSDVQSIYNSWREVHRASSIVDDITIAYSKDFGQCSYLQLWIYTGIKYKQHVHFLDRSVSWNYLKLLVTSCLRGHVTLNILISPVMYSLWPWDLQNEYISRRGVQRRLSQVLCDISITWSCVLTHSVMVGFWSSNLNKKYNLLQEIHRLFLLVWKVCQWLSDFEKCPYFQLWMN